MPWTFKPTLAQFVPALGRSILIVGEGVGLGDGTMAGTSVAAGEGDEVGVGVGFVCLFI